MDKDDNIAKHMAQSQDEVLEAIGARMGDKYAVAVAKAASTISALKYLAIVTNEATDGQGADVMSHVNHAISCVAGWAATEISEITGNKEYKVSGSAKVKELIGDINSLARHMIANVKGDDPDDE